MIIAVDFDGTLADKLKYPYIGEDLGGGFWLSALKQLGCDIILWTCREDEALQMAKEWCEAKNLPIDAYNSEAPKYKGMVRRKVFAHIYVDDNAFGAPMKRVGDRLVFDWEKAGPALVKQVRERLAKGHLGGCGFRHGSDCTCQKFIEERAARFRRRGQ